MTRFSILLLTLLFALPSALPAEIDRRASYSATAFDLEAGTELYTEHHVETWRNGRLAEREVRYESPEGDLIAAKKASYGESPIAPSFEMIDFRHGLREGAEVAADEIVLFSGPTDDEARRRRIDRPETAVIDAGFDAFMRENFDAVRNGRTVAFEFAVPALRRFIRFELVPEGAVRYGGEPAYEVIMRPDNPLLRLAVDPIRLVYSPAGRLLEFRGLANVLDETGDRYEARIVFEYPSTAAGGSTARSTR